MKKNRVTKTCAICSATFDVRASQVNAYATCSKVCSVKYRSLKMTGRKITWAHKIGRKGPRGNLSYITPEYREKQRAIAIANGSGKHYKGKKLSAEHKAKMSAAHKGHTNKGWKLSIETRKRMSEAAPRGENNRLWRGGITTKNAAIRSSFEYKQWRAEVFNRDDFTCQVCRVRGVQLHVDHIKPFALFPELRFDIGNGRTLCVPCHKATPTFLKSGVALVRAVAQYGIQIKET